MNVFKVTVTDRRGRRFTERVIAHSRNAVLDLMAGVYANEPDFDPATVEIDKLADDQPFRPKREEKPRWLDDANEWQALRQRLARDWADPDLRKLMQACLDEGSKNTP